MVFLFPGVLFRKFYFSGKFGSQFEQGNLLERFLWTLLAGVFCLISVTCLFKLVDVFFGVKLLNNLSFDKITDVFICLSSNQFPYSFSNESNLYDFVILLITIYTVSASLGFLCFKVVRTFNLDFFISFLKFRNTWQYLAQHRGNGIKTKIGDVHTTYVDVLTKNNNKEELYKGILHSFINDKDDKLENIVITNSSKFISYDKTEENELKIQSIKESIVKKETQYVLHKEYGDRIVFKKNIEGNLLVISNDNILNINLTYIKTSSKIQGLRIKAFRVVTFLYYVSMFFLVVMQFLNFKSVYFQGFSKKVIFALVCFMLISLVRDELKNLILNNRFSKDATFIEKATIYILILSPLMWVFNLLGGITTSAIFFSIFIIFALFINKKSKQPTKQP